MSLLLQRYERLTPEQKAMFGRMLLAHAVNFEQLSKAMPSLMVPARDIVTTSDNFLKNLEEQNAKPVPF